MKLKQFNAITVPKSTLRDIRPRVTFSKAGTIYFNKAAVSLMGLKEGNTIALSQDEDDKENWYVHLCKDGFALRSNSKKDCLMINHSALITEFKKCFNLKNDKSYNLLLAGQPTIVDKIKYFGILGAANAI